MLCGINISTDETRNAFQEIPVVILPPPHNSQILNFKQYTKPCTDFSQNLCEVFMFIPSSKFGNAINHLYAYSRNLFVGFNP